MKDYLHYKAGSQILNLVREEGIKPERIRVFTAPAGGPKWFVSVGFDRALITSRFLQKGGRTVLLAGASAGAWRCLAMACQDPRSAYEKLRLAYSRNVFTGQDTPVTISAALKRNVDDFMGDADIPFILNHPSYAMAVHTVRSRGPAASEIRGVQGPALIAGALLNVLSPRAMSLLYERAVFFSGSEPPLFVKKGFRGRGVRLTSGNLREAALATGSLPYIIAGVHDIEGAPRGSYRDGGLTDYQLNQDYCPGPEGITLFFHYQERIIPGWFDKKLSWRHARKPSLARVVQIHPGADFLALLPEKRLPDRQDFITFADNPSERIRRWDRVSEISTVLGEEFMEHVESGRVRELVEPIGTRSG